MGGIKPNELKIAAIFAAVVLVVAFLAIWKFTGFSILQNPTQPIPQEEPVYAPVDPPKGLGRH